MMQRRNLQIQKRILKIHGNQTIQMIWVGSLQTLHGCHVHRGFF